MKRLLEDRSCRETSVGLCGDGVGRGFWTDNEEFLGFQESTAAEEYRPMFREMRSDVGEFLFSNDEEACF